MAKLTVRSNFSKAIARLQQLRVDIPQRGQQWAEDSAKLMHGELLDNLATQGRQRTPHLSTVTSHLYSIRGKPNGSGIRNHIRTDHQHSGMDSTAIVGILKGKPTMVAKVQNDGCTIPVSRKMRRWFMAHGVFLNATTLYIRVPGRRFWTKAVIQTTRTQQRKLKRILK